jgi:hypothetical protein
MPTGVWRFLALAGALLALCFVMVDAAQVGNLGDNHVTAVSANGRDYAHLRVVSVTGDDAENGGLLPGDVLAPLFPYGPAQRYGNETIGATYRWGVQRGALHFIATTHVTSLARGDFALYEIFNAVRIAMLLMAIVVAVRRPDDRAARALVTFLALIGLTLTSGGHWLPEPLFRAWTSLRSPLETISLSQGLLYACIFPFASERGLRRWLLRINPWYLLFSAGSVFAILTYNQVRNAEPDLGAASTFLDWSPMAFLAAIAVAFWIAAVGSTGRDRQRVYWAAGSICVGFAGPVLVTILEYGVHYNAAWVEYLALTLLAIPIGLAYTILRHRTVDIGFVISRALVLTILSAGIILAFGLLERALGKLFIDASHIASRSVELALALGLGFSLRSLHAQIERIIDRIFFRHRQRALAALKAFATDVYFITDPDVALERTVAVVQQGADAENAALYLIADGVFGCAAAGEPSGLPAEINENDPLFVRMRASRRPELLREVGSAIEAEIAFPMFVRATLVGALVLAAKRSGEAYDPEENALLADLAQRAGLALDALQTNAMRRELEAVMSADPRPRAV